MDKFILQYNFNELTDYESSVSISSYIKDKTINIELSDASKYEEIIKDAFKIAPPISPFIITITTEIKDVIEKIQTTNLLKIGIKLSISKPYSNVVAIKVLDSFNSKELTSFLTICANAFKIIDKVNTNKIDIWKYMKKSYESPDNSRYNFSISDLPYEQQIMFIALTHKCMPETVSRGNYGCTLEYLMKYSGYTHQQVSAFLNKYVDYLETTGSSGQTIYYFRTAFKRRIVTQFSTCGELIQPELDVMSSIDKKSRSIWLERMSELV